MEPERWKRLARIFEQGVDLPSSELKLYLAEECAEDSSVHALALSLLEADRAAESFLESPPPWEILNPEPKPGDRFGPYCLETEIARGGMGIVFKASRDDDAFDRKVAIKFIRGAITVDSGRQLASERKFLASLDHPGIARLYDGGTTPNGLPYFIMEWIDGSPIDVYCDSHQLDLRQRLELFIKICKAVLFAHQNLIVHRDIKPSNILVTLQGDPKLLDFGIAKWIEGEPEAYPNDTTASWGPRFTLGYASPEQIQGERITVRSDIYGLGALLYRLLTKTLPFDFSSRTPLPEIARTLREETPIPPSKVRPPNALESSPQTSNLTKDLDAIVLKALRQEPQDRYAGVEELIRDLRNYLDGYPVQAHQGSLSYRGRKFLRRNRAAVSVLMIVGSTLVGWSIDANRRATKLAAALEVAQQQQLRSEHMLETFINIFENGDPAAVQGQELTVVEALRAVDPKSFGTNLEDEAILLETMARVFLSVDANSDAVHSSKRALEIRIQLNKSDLAIAHSRSLYAMALREDGKYSEAKEEGFQAVADARALGAPPADLAPPLIRWLTTLCYAEAYQEADEPSAHALELTRATFADDSPWTARALLLRAQIQKKLHQQFAESEALYLEGLEIQRRILGEDHPEISDILLNLADLANLREDFELANQRYRDALRITERIYGQNHMDVALILNNLASSLWRQQNSEEAYTANLKTLKIVRHLKGVENERVIRLMLRLASRLIDAGMAAEALAHLEDPFWIPDWMKVERRWRQAQWENTLAAALSAQGRYRQAEPMLRRSLQALETQLSADHDALKLAYARAAEHYESQGDDRLAHDFRQRALDEPAPH